MIRHIVLIRFRPDVAAATIDAIFADLAAIRQRLPGMLHFAAGRSDSPEKIERGYLHGFTIDFVDWAALAAYAVHPDHQRAAAALVAAAQDGGDGVLVFDLAIPNDAVPT